MEEEETEVRRAVWNSLPSFFLLSHRFTSRYSFFQAAPSSRYDPKTVSKIVDITDLVDDASDSSDDEDIIGHSSEAGAFSVLTKTGSKSNVTKSNNKAYGPGGAGFSFVTKQFLILFLLLGIIVGACVAIGYAVLGASGEATHRLGDNASMGNQQLLETAERVITACSEGRLNEDMSECQNLCHSKMCCFDSGKYNCEKDESKSCAVFAGCEALVDGALLYEDELDEE
jgi:hypothetical protein